MLALSTYVLLSVASAAPAHADKLASTYDEAACDWSQGGECAVEIVASLPEVPAVLDCASPFIQEMIGTCDSPRPTLPGLHVPTVRPERERPLTRVTPGGKIRVVACSVASETALTAPALTAPPPHADGETVDRAPRALFSIRPHRLERPPRA